MKVTLNKTDNVNGMIAIEIEKTDYQENVDKALNQYRRQAQIPGFRQGKVPKGVIQKMDNQDRKFGYIDIHGNLLNGLSSM